MRCVVTSIAFGVLTLFGAGCCHVRESTARREPAPVPSVIAAQVRYTNHPATAPDITEIGRHRRFTIHRVHLPAVAEPHATNRLLELDYYRPHGTNPLAVVVVLPILGGGYPAEKHFCAYFARHGLAAILVRREGLRKTITRLEEVNDTLLHSAIDARQAIDWIETRPELDAGRIGVFGISMGGIRAAFLTPLEPRIRAAVIALAGGDLPFVITHSNEPGLVRRREKFRETHQLTEAAFQEEVQKVITCDPLSVAAGADRSKLLLVQALFDRTVPTRKGLELRRALGKPETIFLPTGHYTSLLFIPYLKPASLQFFHERFADR